MTALARILLAVTFALVHCTADAQTWPAKPVRLLVPFPAGTGPDVVARLLGARLGAAWGQQVVVENRPGAGGVAGMSALVHSPPDGYTLALVPTTVVTLTPVLLKEPPFDAGRDVVPVAMVATSPFMVAVHPGVAAVTLAEFIQLAREQPGKINVAVVALYSGTHLTTELLGAAAGIRLFPVPYNGSPNAVVAAVTGQSHAIVDSIGVVAPQVKAGKLRLLAVTSPQRLSNYPDVPAAAEALPGFQVIGWVAVFGPRNLPAAIVEKANRDVNAAIQTPELAAKLVEIGFYPGPGPQAAFAEFVKTERERWGRIAREAGVQPQ
jgi:tripartite-type tricarboxylate transporter receptor subunit TctC